VRELSQPNGADRRNVDELRGDHRAGAGAMRVRNRIEVLVSVVPVEMVSGEVEREDREPQVVRPQGIRLLVSVTTPCRVAHRHEHAERDHHQSARPDGLAGEAAVRGTCERLDQHDCHGRAQQGVDEPPKRPHRTILDAVAVR
jgi:hypothetical protein